MNFSTPGLLFHHQPPELAQTHVHSVSDAIQTCRLVSSPSPPAFNLSQHQGIFQRVSSLQSSWPKFWSFSFSLRHSNEYSGLISFRILLGFTGLILQFKGPSRVFSNTTVQKHQFFSAQPSLWSNSHIHA